jgi:hypothetical protein
MDSLGNNLWLKHLSSPSQVLEGGELIADGSDGVAFGMGMKDVFTADDLIGVQTFIPPTSASYPIFFQYNKEGQLVNSLECPYSLFGTAGEISRSGDYIYLDIIYAGGMILGADTLTSNDLTNKDAALARIYLPRSTIGLQTVEPKQPYSLTVYPNPAKNELNIVTNYTDKMLQAQIITIDGKVVKQFSLLSGQPSTINIESLQSGIYFIIYGNLFSKIQKL